MIRYEVVDLHHQHREGAPGLHLVALHHPPQDFKQRPSGEQAGQRIIAFQAAEGDVGTLALHRVSDRSPQDRARQLALQQAVLDAVLEESAGELGVIGVGDRHYRHRGSRPQHPAEGDEAVVGVEDCLEQHGVGDSPCEEIESRLFRGDGDGSEPGQTDAGASLGEQDLEQQAVVSGAVAGEGDQDGGASTHSNISISKFYAPVASPRWPIIRSGGELAMVIRRVDITRRALISRRALINRRARIPLVATLISWVLVQPGGAQPSEPSEEPIWFGALAAAEPLPEESAAELARHLAAVALGPNRSSRLPRSLAADREPRMFVLSLSDGAGPARVLRAAGRGAGAAATRLAKEVRGLRTSGFEPGLVKVDLVREVHRREKFDPDRRLPLARSLFGLAFEGDVGLAFLAEEVVARTLINSDQELRLRNVRKHPRAAFAQQRLEALDRAETVTLYRFSTTSFFSDGDGVAPLFRGHRSFADPGPEELLRHAVLAGDYLTRAVEESGRFVYSYLPKTDEEDSDYNALRHAGTA